MKRKGGGKLRGRGKTDWILLLFIICWRTWHLLWKWERVTEQKKEGKTSYSTDKEAVVRKLASLTHRNIWLKGVLMHYSTKGKYILTGPKVHNTTHAFKSFYNKNKVVSEPRLTYIFVKSGNMKDFKLNPACGVHGNLPFFLCKANCYKWADSSRW